MYAARVAVDRQVDEHHRSECWGHAYKLCLIVGAKGRPPVEEKGCHPIKKRNEETEHGTWNKAFNLGKSSARDRCKAHILRPNEGHVIYPKSWRGEGVPQGRH